MTIRRESRMQEAKKTLIRVVLLIWVLAAVVLAAGGIVCLISPFPFVPFLLGELLGSAVSSVLMFHRYQTLDVELDLERKGAVNHSKIMASLRSLIALGALFLSFYLPHVFSPVAMFAGLFATKAAALLYPIVFRTKCLSDNK